MGNYQDFIHKKTHIQIDESEVTQPLNSHLFDFQEHVARQAIKRGRCAVFLDTGLGKTIIQLSIADYYVQHENKRVLILTPLAVAFQFIREAEKFDVKASIKYSPDGSNLADITVCNYEQLKNFNHSDFDVVMLDESSILKNFKGTRRKEITSFMRHVRHRFLFTATPAPNDFIELGTSSEVLGYMGHMDMMTKYFTSNIRSVDSNAKFDKFQLKPHATDAFWSWVTSWSVSMRKPSDFGFSDDRHVLPNLNEKTITVARQTPLVVDGQASLFNLPASSFHEVRSEVRATLTERCEKAVECAKDLDPVVYWVNLNDEGDLIAKLDPSATQIKGSMSIDVKQDILKKFADGEITRLITKSKITGFGLNWQHCANTVVFPTYSFEQYYQTIRRFWRFGQTQEVNVYRIISDGQVKVLESLESKHKAAIQMFDSIVGRTLSAKPDDEKHIVESIEMPSVMVSV